MIDFFSGDFTLATLCAKMRIPYAGFVLSEVHQTLGFDRITSNLMNAKFAEGTDMYDAKFALLMKQQQSAGSSSKSQKKTEGEPKKAESC